MKLTEVEVDTRGKVIKPIIRCFHAKKKTSLDKVVATAGGEFCPLCLFFESVSLDENFILTTVCNPPEDE